jgi:urate oxidase
MESALDQAVARQGFLKVTAKLIDHQYGKSRVRVLKVLRNGARHAVQELEVSVRLSGDFESSYTAGDNSRVILTDTMKNTVNVLAQDHLGAETERFAVALAKHFLQQYGQVERVVISTWERQWERLQVNGEAHPHSFVQAQQARPTVHVTATAGETVIRSGVEDLLILKSTGSSFRDYPKDEFTTLPEAVDRIFATSLAAHWMWTAAPADYNAANGAILEAMLAPFALNHSPSVQTTLFQMGEAALGSCVDIDEIFLAMPNKHYLPMDLTRFGRENRQEMFLPTDEPAGQIEATLTRG